MPPVTPITGESAAYDGTNPSPDHTHLVGDQDARTLECQSRCVTIAGRDRRAHSRRYAWKSGAVAWLSVPHRTRCSVAGMRGGEPSLRAVCGNGQGLLGNPAGMPRRLPAAGALWPSPEAPCRCAPWRWLWTWRAWRRSGQQLLDRGLQAGQRLAIEPGTIGDPRHAEFTELGQVRASGPGVAVDRPGDAGDQGGDVLLVADADRVDAVGPGRQVEAASAYRLCDPLFLRHPGCWQEGVGARVDDDRNPGVARGGPDGRQ